MKKYNTIGCCGIDCGLCPRFHIKGDSACPGCDGLNFRQKHPSCGFLTCCAIKHGLEVCSECKDYPCSRFDPERKGFDSFVTHRRIFPNLESIKSNGMDTFINQQQIRMTILSEFLLKYDDGRSKSFICQCCTLLPLETLQKEWKYITNNHDSLSIKEKSKIVKERMLIKATEFKIELKLKKRM
jgi:hypothetical protein